MEGVLVEEDLNGRASMCGSLSFYVWLIKFLGNTCSSCCRFWASVLTGGIGSPGYCQPLLPRPAQWMARTGCASSPWFKAGRSSVPFLFIIAIDPLHQLIQRAAELQLIGPLPGRAACTRMMQFFLQTQGRKKWTCSCRF